ncbi:glycosyl hydrolase family 28-related protein [Klebsiella variicola subsp. variicola]|uniref:glycosyl hydrolase family 28-related protein n=1 Tax=Klebsiella variicola TaxID=244366 RepID=UPI00359F81F8
MWLFSRRDLIAKILPLSIFINNAEANTATNENASSESISVNSYDCLRHIIPKFSGQRVKLNSYYTNSIHGGGIFVSVYENKKEDYGVTCKVNDDWSWVRIIDGPITPYMFGAFADGVNNDSLFIQRAVDYYDALYSTRDRAPRGEIYFPAGIYCIGETITIRNGPISWRGDGIWNTIFVPIQNASQHDNTFLFKFENEKWDSNQTRYLHEIMLCKFSIKGNYVNRSAFYLGGCGWDCIIDAVHIWGVGQAAFVCYDLMDTSFRDVRINLCGMYFDANKREGNYSHPIMLLSRYDCCNAIRFDACHFEGNFTGVLYVNGRANNISFVNMCKFEENGIGSKFGCSFPVILIDSSLAESIRFNDVFVSHTSKIKNYFIKSNSKHLILNGGSYISPSDEYGFTGAKWFHIHRENWNDNTRCIGAIINIDLIYVNYKDNDVPFKFESQAIVNINALRVARPNKLAFISYSCQINIKNITFLDVSNHNSAISLFEVDNKAGKVVLNVDCSEGDSTNLRWVNDISQNKLSSLKFNFPE